MTATGAPQAITDDTVPYHAERGCYLCQGTGKIDGFGHAGHRCLCIATCDECGGDVAWLHDDERAPKVCNECRACEADS